jgi:hypothetical protein
MSLEFLDFSQIKPILDQALIVQGEIRQTENQVKEVESIFSSMSLGKTNVRKLIADVRAQISKGIDIQQIYFKTNNNSISVSPTQINSSLDTTIRQIIQNCLSKDITASAIEPVKRKQVQTIGATLKQHGITKQIFDKIIVLSGMDFAENYLIKVIDNYLLEVSEFSMDGGGGEEPPEPVQVVEPISVVYMEYGEIALNPYNMFSTNVFVVVPTELDDNNIGQNVHGMKIKLEIYNESEQFVDVLFLTNFVVHSPSPEEANSIIEEAGIDEIDLPTEEKVQQTLLVFQFLIPTFHNTPSFGFVKLYAESFIDLYTTGPDSKKVVPNKTELLATISKDHIESIVNPPPPLEA